MRYDAAHLLVDGYSIIYAWPALRATLRRNLERARDQLVVALTPIQDATGIRVTVVFDSRQGARVAAGELPAGLDVMFTRKGMTADGWIERVVAQATAPEQFLVATNDHAEATMVRSLGGRAITAEELQDWLESETGALRQTVRQMAENSRAHAAGKMNPEICLRSARRNR
jgi:predicted RNA-binding protein with PIN domain